MKVSRPKHPENRRRPHGETHRFKPHAPMCALLGGLFLATAALFGLSLSAEAKPYAYVFNIGSGDVSVIDTEAQEVIDTVDVGLRIRWFSSRFFDGKRVWATDAALGKAEVVVFDPWTLKTLKRIQIGKGPAFGVELTPDHRFAVAAAAGSDEVVVIDARTYEIVRRIPTGKFPCDLTLSLDGRLAFEVDRDQDTLSVIDWQAGTTLETVSLEGGSKPHMLTLSPDGRRLWVQERETSKISVFDAQTFERVARLSVGKGPATTEFTPSRRFAVTTHIADQMVKVFESGSFKEVKTIQVGQNPVNSVFHPDGRYAYVTNKASNTVSIIDVERWEAVKTLDVGNTPWGIYLFDPTRGEMAGNR